MADADKPEVKKPEPITDRTELFSRLDVKTLIKGRDLGGLEPEFFSERVKNLIGSEIGHFEIDDRFYNKSNGRTSATLEMLLDNRDGLKELAEDYKTLGGVSDSGMQRFMSRDARTIERETTALYRDLGKTVKENEKIIAAVRKSTPKIAKEIGREVTDRIAEIQESLHGLKYGSDEYKVLKKEAETLQRNMTTIQSHVMDEIHEFVGKRQEIIEQAKGMAAEFEKRTGIGALQHMGLDAAKLGEQAVVKTEAAAGKEIEQVAKGSHVPGAVAGAVIGGALGYMTTEDPNNKATNAVVGAGAGGLLGWAASLIFRGMNTAKTSMGAALHGRPAQEFLSVASHLHR